jgi:hypothetical protein
MSDRYEDLKPLLTDEFLTTLATAARTYGNDGDWPAVEEFVNEMFYWAGKEKPDLTLFEGEQE